MKSLKRSFVLAFLLALFAPSNFFSQNISITVSDSSVFCTGDSAILTATGCSSYLWNTGATSTSITVTAGGTYWVTGTGSCTGDTAFQIITTETTPQISITTLQNWYCSGSYLVLNAITSGGGIVTWKDSTVGTIDTVDRPGSVYAILSNTCGSATSNIEPITEIQWAISQIQTPSTIICPGQTLTLSASGTGNYFWVPDSVYTDSIIIWQPGTYMLASCTNCGTKWDTLVIYGSTITSSFIPSPVTGVAPLSVSFTNTSVNSISNTWTFESGSQSNATDPAYVFNNAGTYSVTLTTENPDGCLATSVHEIIVLPETSFLTVPNIFSPNGDNINDNLDLNYHMINSIEFTIVNRWNEEVFSTNSLTEAWNGKNKNNRDCPAGTYFYSVKAKGSDDHNYNFQGYIQLIR